ncbi:MAG: hypothetical protein NVS4B12_17680 [Ktedonobacteraceae bacterium]
MQTTTTYAQHQQERREQLMQQPVQQLASALRKETENFRQQRSYDDLSGFTLFTLAIVQRNDEAWSALYQHFSPLVLSWIAHHHSAAPLLFQDGSSGPLVNAAFAKFSQAVTPEKMEHFDSLAAILKYLKMCVHSVVADEVRSRQARHCEESLDAVERAELRTDDPAEDVVTTMSSHTFWQLIQQELRGEEEQIVMRLSYLDGMKPREISRLHERLFPTFDDVYRVKRNVFERLRRNRQLQGMYDNS